MKTSLTGFNTI